MHLINQIENNMVTGRDGRIAKRSVGSLFYDLIADTKG